MNTGPFIAHETFLNCPQHGEIHRSEDLQRLVPFKGTYGYDVVSACRKSFVSSLYERAGDQERAEVKGHQHI